jgi:hypothetical protein
MTPDDIASRHPVLYHLTERGGADSIRRNGLWSTARLLDGCSLDDDRRVGLLTQRRPHAVHLHHERFGPIALGDNRPLSETKLANCLDDGLTPADWLRLLNEHVFFFVREKDFAKLAGSSGNKGRAKELMVLDTLPLLRACSGRVSLSPINSGNTVHDAKRRGRATFQPICDVSFDIWRRQRGLAKPDTIKEVIIRDGVPEAGNFLREVIALDTASGGSS